MQCAPNRDRREEEDARSGFALREANAVQSRRSANECDWITLAKIVSHPQRPLR
jgi:hypothetical protein